MRTPNVRLLLAGLFTLGFFTSTAPAAAQDAASKTASAQETAAEKSESEAYSPLLIAFDADLVSGSFGTTSFLRTGIGTGLRYNLSRRAGLEFGLHAAYLRLAFNHEPSRGLVTRGVLWSPLEPAGHLGLSFAPLAAERHRLEIVAITEISLPGLEQHLSDFHVKTRDGNADLTGFGEKQVETEMFWRRFSLGLRYQMRHGRFESLMGIALEAISSAVELRLSKSGSSTLRSLGYDDRDISRRYSEPRYAWIVPIRLGLGYELRGGHRLEAGGLFAPGAGPALGANLGYTYHW